MANRTAAHDPGGGPIGRRAAHSQGWPARSRARGQRRKSSPFPDRPLLRL